MPSRRYDLRFLPPGCCKYWYEGRGCRLLARGLPCLLEHPDVWRERNFCHKYQDGRGCGHLCPRIHGEQPVFDVHTYLLNKAREDYVWRLAIIEVARALAAPVLAITDISSDSSEELPVTPPAPGYPQHNTGHPHPTGGLIPVVPPKVYPNVPRFYDISGEGGSANGPEQGQTTANYMPPWETASPAATTNTAVIVKAIPKSSIQPKLAPPPLPAHFRVPPQRYAQAVGTSATAEQNTDFEC